MADGVESTMSATDETVEYSLEQANQEVRRLKGIYPVVELLDAEEVETERNCLLNGEGCPCMRLVCADLLHDKSHETRTLQMGDSKHKATARYVEVDGVPHVLMYALPLASSEYSIDTDLLYLDALTGVFNRRYYEDVLRSRHVYAGVAIIDLDDFKLVNDTFGHHAGDIAIKTAVKTMDTCIRGGDSLVRFGGDEFVLVMPSVSSEDFNAKLHEMAERVKVAAVKGYDAIELSISVGGVMAAGRTVEEAVNQADKLMYRAKQHADSVLTDADDIDVEEYRRPKLLIVDDSRMNRDILNEMLRDDYDIMEAEGGQEAISILEQYSSEISLVLLDIIMPDVSGFDVLSRMVRSGWLDDIPVIMISSEDAEDTVLRAYELGASDYVSRPFDMRVVRQRVSNIMRLYAKQRRLSAMLAQQYYEREKDASMLVNVMGGAMELRNGESGPHVRHVRGLVEILLERLVQKSDKYAITSSERSSIGMASVLHDIGKLAIPDNVLNKPGRLTDEEFAIMKTHSALGAEMLESMDEYGSTKLLQIARDICRWHHERFDGKGYPDGLVGDQIPIAAQVTSIADVYDALTSDRVYKKAYSHEKAMQMILDGECGVFNPLLLDCLVDVQDRIRSDWDEQTTPPRFLAL